MGGAEPASRPRPAPCGVEARPRSAEDGRDLFLGQLLDQAALFPRSVLMGSAYACNRGPAERLVRRYGMTFSGYACHSR